MKIQSGIYKIVNLTNNKIYIGSAKSINRRWKRHICELNNHTHHNIILQNAWDKYGSDKFILEIIEVFDDSSILLKIEQYYVDLLNPFGDNGYNIAKQTSGGDTLTGNPKRLEIIDKISTSMKMVWDNKSLEEKETFGRNISGSNNPSWNGGSSIKYCKCGTKIAPVNTCCRKCLDFTENNNPFYGKTHTDEYKLVSSKNRKGKYYGTQNKPIIIDEIEYTSNGSAAIVLGLNKLTVRYRVLSKNFQNYNYK